MNKYHATIAGIAACAFLAGSASADLMWDEAIDGDISGDYMNPTQMYTKGVNNHVIFTTVGGNPEQDREYFTFTIAEGYELVSIVLDNFDTDPESNLGFIGVASGTSFPTPPDAPDPTQLLGFALVGMADVGDDILQSMGQAGGSIGFTGPLGPGSYTFWAQETGPSTDDWDLNFIVTQGSAPAVPGPGALAGLIGIATIAGRRRRG